MWASVKQAEDGVRRSSHSDSGFMKTDIRGELDVAETREMLSQIMTACKGEDITRILIDCREASSHSTVTDVWTLARDLGSLGVTRENRVAILNRPKDGFDRRRFSSSAPATGATT